MLVRVGRSRLTLLWLVVALGFAGVAPAQQYTFRTYGLDQGLTNLGVKRLHQDRQGFLWVSTEGGVFRYDGERFQSFGPKEGLPVSNAVAFGEAPDGSLLVGGQIGLFRKVGDRFVPVPMPGPRSVSWFSGIQFDGRATTWIATEAGLLTIRIGAAGALALHLLPKPPGVNDPVANGLLVEGHAVWYGCDQQVCRVENGSVTVFGPREGLPASKWKGIQRAGTGDLWVQGRTEVARLRAGSGRFEVEPAAFRDVAAVGVPGVDTTGSVLFGTNDGLTIREGNSWRRVGRRTGLRGTVYCALQDREGSLWIGLLGRGLVRWVGYREWQAFTTDSGLESDVIYQVLPLPDGSVWAASEAGLFHGMPSAGSWSWKKQPPFAGVAVHSISPDGSGRLWLGTESKGAARFNPVSGKVEWFTEGQGLTGRNPYILTLDRRGRIWAATDRGLFVADGKELRFRQVPSLPAIQTWAVIEAANGDIWAGTVEGLFRLSEEKWSHFRKEDGLRQEAILSLAAAKNGDVWIGYQYAGGVDRLRMKNGRPEIVQPANQPAMMSGTTYFLGFDRRDNLWAGTDVGVNVWDGASWRHYDSHDGLVWNDCDLNGFAAAPDGSIWIGTSGGLARLLPQAPTTRRYTPEVIYTKTILGNKEVDPSSQPSVEHSSKTLYSRFSTLVFARETSIRFRYRLLPLFETWHETGQREVQFDGLRPGRYRLEVLARDGWGHWSAEPARFSFEILTPWWRGPWAIPILVTVPVLLVVAVSRLRGAALRRRERKLMRLVEARTAELREANEHLLQLSRIEHEKKLADEQAAHAQEIAALNRRAMVTMALAIEAKDQTTGSHLHRVEVYATEVARKMQLDDAQMEALKAAAILHDIGKLAVPEHIISKPGRLTPEEFETMKIHTVVGAELVEQMHFPYAVAPIVRAHHERWNGTGYPDGLAGERIPLGARILAAVDCLDALTSDRQYRRALPLEQAVEYLRREAGQSFDPSVIEVLGSHYLEFERQTQVPTGRETARLSTGVKIIAGASPAAGFQKSAGQAAWQGDLARLASAVDGPPQQTETLAAWNLKFTECGDLAAAFAFLRSSLRNWIPCNVMVLYVFRGDRLDPQYADGDGSEIFASSSIPMGTGMSGWVAVNQKAILNGNPSVEPAYLNHPEQLRVLRSALAVPLLAGTALAGVFSLYSVEQDAFSEAHLAQLATIGSKLGPAIRSAAPVLPLQ